MMSDEQLNWFLFGTGVGALGAIEQACNGTPASEMRTAAFECIEVSARHISASAVADRYRASSLLEMLSDAKQGKRKVRR